MISRQSVNELFASCWMLDCKAMTEFANHLVNSLIKMYFQKHLV